MRLSAFVVFLWVSNSFASVHHAQEFVDSMQHRADAGAQIVQHYCAVCHAKKPLIVLGAPRIGETADWQPRLVHGLALLLKHTQDGYHAMPPRGGCFECSDEQLQQAIVNMLPPDLIKKRKRMSIITTISHGLDRKALDPRSVD